MYSWDVDGDGDGASEGAWMGSRVHTRLLNATPSTGATCMTKQACCCTYAEWHS